MAIVVNGVPVDGLVAELATTHNAVGATLPPAVEAGADGVLAASVIHVGQLRVGDVKAGLAAAGIPAPLEADSPLR